MEGQESESPSTEEGGELLTGPAGGKGGQSSELHEGNMTGAQEPEVMSTKQVRIAAWQALAACLHVTGASYRRPVAEDDYLMTRRDGAVGIDGQTADDFARDFENNVQRLLEAAKSGRYRAAGAARQ